MLESLFKNVVDLKASNFIKKSPQNRCFSVNLAKFLILFISKIIGEGLVSMVDCYIDLKVEGLDCMMALGFRV